MDAQALYKMLREEILDQRKCQFQMYTIAAAGASGSLLFAEKSSIGALAFLAPIVFNIAAILMIVIKELSIFRKVAYLQLLEQHTPEREWKWGTDLDDFRADKTVYEIPVRSRNHTYPQMLCAFINIVNIFAGIFYFFSRADEASLKILAPRTHGFVDALCIALIMTAAGITTYYFRHLAAGKYTTSSIIAKWRHVLKL